MSCPFCRIAKDEILLCNFLAFGVLDAYPVSDGHTLIVPKRHFASFHEATKEELSAMFDLIAEAIDDLRGKYQPDGFNIGINDGEAAGQTIPHLHIHIIPRYAGDVPDPRGGIRLLFPDKARYWDLDD